MTEQDDYPRAAIPLGWLVAACARWRRATARRRGARPGVPVVSVGNLVLGGAGKTPMVRKIASWLGDEGLHCAILSRGYGRPESRKEVTRVSLRGQLEVEGWQASGDEPWMLARALPRASVYVHPNRALAGRAAVRDGAQVLLLDDGFQHFKVARDLEVVCVRGDEAGLRVLPAGPLREPMDALAYADVVVHVRDSGASGAEDELQPELLERLRRAARRDALWVEARTRVTDLLTEGGATVPPEWLKGRSVGLLSGIARHPRFVRTVESLGAHVEAIHSRRDHHLFSGGELDALRKDLLWVTTEKDAVRLPSWFNPAILRVRLELLDGLDDFHSRIREALHK